MHRPTSNASALSLPLCWVVIIHVRACFTCGTSSPDRWECINCIATSIYSSFLKGKGMYASPFPASSAPPALHLALLLSQFLCEKKLLLLLLTQQSIEVDVDATTLELVEGKWLLFTTSNFGVPPKLQAWAPRPIISQSAVAQPLSSVSPDVGTGGTLCVSS
jgi:hypothetical protein